MSSDKAKQVNLYDAKTHLSQLVKEAAAGREIIIANAGTPMARLVPLVAEARVKREPGRMKDQIWIASDFDDPLPPNLLAAFYGDDVDSNALLKGPSAGSSPKKRKKRRN
jgi:prevent-host-death family protein